MSRNDLAISGDSILQTRSGNVTSFGKTNPPCSIFTRRGFAVAHSQADTRA